jgi:hypothetical protein
MIEFPNDKYCKLEPTDKQKEFLALKDREAFFGGAAGGGKSVALLMAALQYVDQPGYAALILRKDTQRLSLPGGLIPRSHEWLAKTNARWNEARRTWTFPHEEGPPATLTFGYLCKPDDKFRYLSSEFQYIAFDELTELTENDYLYLFSRLRRTTSLGHVPLRIRSASNPGGPGHAWVKARFIDGSHPDRIYLPSKISDNKYLDAEEYRQSLMYLMPVTRERMLHGDWSVQDKTIFRDEWLRFYMLSGDQFDLLAERKVDPDGPNKLLHSIRQSDCRRFITVDPAGTSDEAAESSGRSFSVIQAWDQPKEPRLSKYLILWRQLRVQCSLTELSQKIMDAHLSWKAEKTWIEGEKLGHGLVAELRKHLPKHVVEPVPTHGHSKEMRAIPLAYKMERGEVFLPLKQAELWMGFKHELLAWTGSSREPCDQIDAAAYAAIIAEQQAPGVFVMQHIANA